MVRSSLITKSLVLTLSLVFIILLFSLPARATPSSFLAEIVAVLEGDTIKVLKSRQVITVKLQGVDAPDTRQRYGKQAKDFVEELAFGKKIVVNLKGVDAQEHFVAEVILADGRSLNRELVKAGYAWWDKQHSEDLSLWRLEAKARDNKLGLWLGEDPIPPWEFLESLRAVK